MSAEENRFIAEPDPDHPGWTRWSLSDPTLYNNTVLGPLLVRPEGPDICRVRLTPQRHHSNGGGTYHGGTTLGLIDVALFAAHAALRGRDASRAVTLDMSTQFVGPGKMEMPLDCMVEIVQETGRLCFLRGLVVQEEHRVASFNATIRKFPQP